MTRNECEALILQKMCEIREIGAEYMTAKEYINGEINTL
jgi:hypothetical protein